jgi:hypothetical protein
MMSKTDKKDLPARISRLIDFIEKKSKTEFTRFFILNNLLKYGEIYDLPLLMNYFRIQDKTEVDADLLETITHRLRGIK